MNDDNKNFVGGLALGSVLGVVLGLLIAPESGVKTRQKLKSKLFSLKDYLTDEAGKISSKAKSVLGKGKVKAKSKKNK